MNRKTSTNYIGRQVDLELLNGITTPEGQIKTTIGFGVTGPKIVAGIQKAIQQYVNLLLSELDTKKFESDIGGTIFSSVQKGVVNSSGYMTHIFNLANLNAFTVIKSDLQAIPYSVIPADERLTSASLLSVDIDMPSSTITLNIELTTEAGNQYTFIVPVSSGIQSPV